MEKWRVRHSVTLAGYDENGLRRNIIQYQVKEGGALEQFWYPMERCEYEFPAKQVEPAIRVVGGNFSNGGGDLFIRLSEFDQLSEFPNVEDEVLIKQQAAS